MKRFMKPLIVLLLLAVAAPAALAQEDPEDVIYGYYQQYLKRSPQRPEVRGWARQVDIGGMSLGDVQVGILASPEYFSRHHNNPRSFIRGLYRDILGRNAARNEVDAWLGNYVVLQGNRDALVRQFLNAAQTELNLRQIGYRYR
jgi:hypothetical protein